MPKKNVISDVYVRVEVEEPWLIKNKTPEEILKQKADTAQSVARSIERHIDGYENAYVEEDRMEVCSYCGKQWTEDDSNFNGGCCDKDMEHDPDPECILQEKHNRLIYHLTKDAARDSFADYLKQIEISKEEYEEIKKLWRIKLDVIPYV